MYGGTALRSPPDGTQGGGLSPTAPGGGLSTTACLTAPTTRAPLPARTNRVRLTQKFVDEAKVRNEDIANNSGRTLYWDEALPGFGLVVTA